MENEVVYGKNQVLEVLRSKEVSKVFKLSTLNSKEIMDEISIKNVPYVNVEKTYLDNLSNSTKHQGIVAITSPVEFIETSELIEKNQEIKNPLVIMLDEVQDPQNLGAIIRIVDSFAINGIVFNKRRNVQLTSTVARTSAGAINHVDICRVTNLRQEIERFKKAGYFVGFLDMNGKQEVSQVKFDIPMVIIIGGEDKGVTDSIKKKCDFGINIKMNGHVNSLNVSSAVSILSYQKNISR